MAESVVENLRARGAAGVVVSTRRYENAVALAERHGGSALRFESLPEAVEDADIIISSTASPRHVLSRERVAGLLALRRNKPLFMIDIAMPRDIDPAVGELEGAFLYNLDDLQQVVEENRAWREAEARRAGVIVDEEVEKFAAYLHEIEAEPVLRALHEKAEAARAAELDRTRARLGNLTPEQEESLDKMTQALVKRLLGGPAEALRDAARNGEGHDLVRAARKLFRLE
jgi:glutamyl-tRNA reductase